MRAVTRNINFPVGDTFHFRSKEPLPLCIAIASPRYTTTFNINTFSKSIKAPNLHIPEEHVPFTWYIGKTDGEGSRSQEYLTFAPEPSCCRQQGTKDKHNRSYSLTGHYKTLTRTADYRLSIKHGLRYKTRTKHYGLGIEYGPGYKTRTEHDIIGIKHERMVLH